MSAIQVELTILDPKVPFFFSVVFPVIGAFALDLSIGASIAIVASFYILDYSRLSLILPKDIHPASQLVSIGFIAAFLLASWAKMHLQSAVKTLYLMRRC